MSLFQKAKKESLKLRLAIIGPSGSGKTLSALKIARGLVGKEGKIAVIDTENGSASLYSDKYSFDVATMNSPYLVKKYLDAMKIAEDESYDCLIIDSLTHAWAGEGGLLQKKEQMDARGGNSFANWGVISKEHEALKNAILHPKCHLICTMRSKQEYLISQNDKGKSEIKKVGMAPVQREGMEYEFDVCLDLDMTHHAVASKDRTGIFQGISILCSEDTGKELAGWLKGEEKKEEPAKPTSFENPEAHERALKLLALVAKQNGWSENDVSREVGCLGYTAPAELSWAELNDMIKHIEKNKKVRK